MSKFSAKEFDELLSKNSVKPTTLLAHPDAVFGYFFKKQTSRLRLRFFTRLGRAVKNRRVYWMGFPIVFVDGLVDILNIRRELANGTIPWEIMDE